MIAAEFFKNASWTFDVLPTLTEHQKYHLEKLAETSAVAVREATLAPLMAKLASGDSVKRAEELTISPLKTVFVTGALGSILGKHRDGQDVEEQARRDSPEGQDSPRPSHPGVELEVDDDSAMKFVQKNLAEIDKLRQAA